MLSHAYAHTVEREPNTQATPVMAQDVIRRIREVPISRSNMWYCRVTTLEASGYNADHIVASEETRDLIVERSEAKMASEIGCFPRPFRAIDSVPGLMRPTITFKGAMNHHCSPTRIPEVHRGTGVSCRCSRSTTGLLSTSSLFQKLLGQVGNWTHAGSSF